MTVAPRHLLELRDATSADSDLLLRWKNDPDAVKYSRSGRPVTEKSHRIWIAARLSTVPARLWIAEARGAALGVVRMDVKKEVAAISIEVAPGRRGSGLGLLMLHLLCRVAEADAGVSRMVAEVHMDNVASLRTFDGAGFRRSRSASDGFYVF